MDKLPKGMWTDWMAFEYRSALDAYQRASKPLSFASAMSARRHAEAIEKGARALAFGDLAHHLFALVHGRAPGDDEVVEIDGNPPLLDLRPEIRRTPVQS